MGDIRHNAGNSIVVGKGRPYISGMTRCISVMESNDIERWEF